MKNHTQSDIAINISKPKPIYLGQLDYQSLHEVKD